MDASDLRERLSLAACRGLTYISRRDTVMMFYYTVPEPLRAMMEWEDEYLLARYAQFVLEQGD